MIYLKKKIFLKFYQDPPCFDLWFLLSFCSLNSACWHPVDISCIIRLTVQFSSDLSCVFFLIQVVPDVASFCIKVLLDEIYFRQNVRSVGVVFNRQEFSYWISLEKYMIWNHRTVPLPPSYRQTRQSPTSLIKLKCV